MSSQQLQNILSALQRQQKQNHHAFPEGNSSGGKVQMPGMSCGAPLGTLSNISTSSTRVQRIGRPPFINNATPKHASNALISNPESSDSNFDWNAPQQPGSQQSNATNEKGGNNVPVASGLSSLIRHLPLNLTSQVRPFNVPPGGSAGSANATKHFDSPVSSSSMSNSMGFGPSMCNSPGPCGPQGAEGSRAGHYNFKEGMCTRIASVSTSSHESRLQDAPQPGSHPPEVMNSSESAASVGAGDNVMCTTWSSGSVRAPVANAPPTSQATSRHEDPSFGTHSFSFRDQAPQSGPKAPGVEGYSNVLNADAPSANNQFHSSNNPSFSMEPQPVIVALRLGELSIPPGSWQFDMNDIKQLMSCFGVFDWVKLLELPTGADRAPNCAIAQFPDPQVGVNMVKTLNGFVVPGIGKLAVVMFAASLLNRVSLTNDTLTSFVLLKLQEQSRETLGAPTANVLHTYPESLPTTTVNSKMFTPETQDEKALNYIIDTLTENRRGTDEGIAALISAISRSEASDVPTSQGSMMYMQRNIPVSSGMLQSSSNNPVVPNTIAPSVETNAPPLTGSAGVSSAGPSTTPVTPGSVKVDMTSVQQTAPLRKLVCRLELVDMFSFYPEFDVPAFIVGNDGSNIKYVLKEAKNRVDIDLVGIPVNEASIAERLHLTITSFDKEAYTIAVETLEDLLQSLCQQLVDFCIERNGTMSCTVGFRRHEYKEGSDGQMIYLGQTERPKPWLNKLPAQSIIR